MKLSVTSVKRVRAIVEYLLNDGHDFSVVYKSLKYEITLHAPFNEYHLDHMHEDLFEAYGFSVKGLVVPR